MKFNVFKLINLLSILVILTPFLLSPLSSVHAETTEQQVVEDSSNSNDLKSGDLNNSSALEQRQENNPSEETQITEQQVVEDSSNSNDLKSGDLNNSSALEQRQENNPSEETQITDEHEDQEVIVPERTSESESNISTGLKTERNMINLLTNPNFLFDRGVEETIPHWELASSTTPVNFLSRNLTISRTPALGGWYELSDSDFSIGSTFQLQVNRPTGTRTLMASQTIQTVQGNEYNVQVRGFRPATTSAGNLDITVYNGSGRIAGPIGLNRRESYSLNQGYQFYGMRFTANSDQSTIGFRLEGSNSGISIASVTPVRYSLKLESLPSIGGSVKAEVDLLVQGQTTTIAAIPNPGYRFIGWQTNAGTNSVISDPNAANTTFTMGNSDVTLQAVFEKEGIVFVHHIDFAGNKLADSKELRGAIGESYETNALEIENYKLTEEPNNAKGTFTEEDVNVTYIYNISQVIPVDPLKPEIEVEPENKPELPKDQGLLSIDFVSSFNFGSQVISVHDQTYYAQPQRLLNEDGTVNENEERPNYIQISDRRAKSERNGWQLAVTQATPFIGEEGQILRGAQLGLSNQKLIPTQTNTEHPSLQLLNPISLVPGNKRTLLRAEGTEGLGTWLYSFGDQQSAQGSVTLAVPGSANPDATRYETTLVWELSIVPGN